MRLKRNENASKGWKQKVCLVCTNGEQDISIDNYVAEQGNVCAFGYDVIKDPLPKDALNFPYNPDDGS
jgi:hypothetical protein